MTKAHIPVRDAVDSIIADYSVGSTGRYRIGQTGYISYFFNLNNGHFASEPSLPQQCADRLVAYVESLLEEA